ncbi:MAG: S41 family peptidase, partial [Candidatus Saccharimonadales bacterium]
MLSDSFNHAKGKPSARALVKGGIVGTAAVAIFLFGMGVGNKTISFGSAVQPVASKDAPADLDYSNVEALYDLIRNNYDGKIDTAKVYDGLKAGLAKATGDPYTEYFNNDEAKKFDNELNGSFTGIGAELGEDDKGNLIIVSPIEGFPASKAGLRPQDMIVSIDTTSTNDMTIDEAVSRIRGEKGTKVTLRIFRNKTEDLSFTIERDAIKIPSVKWELLDGGVGSIRVNQFGPDTTQLMQQAAKELKEKGAKAVLLDLRGNPGGLLSAAVEMSSLWLPEGKNVLQEKRGGLVVESYTANGQAGTPFNGMKTIVLVNAGSASASEIVAGALRDNNAATIYGEKSYGKGSVQEIRNLPGGGEIKITVARWYRPNGENIDKKGIKPDTEIKMTDED